MQPTIFTKIINGEIPCHKVYEDDFTLAFMDIHPVQPGMVLVVTKVQIDSYLDLDDATYDALWRAVRFVGRKMVKLYPNKKKIAVQVEGLDVAHVHVKLLPINTGAEFRAKPDFEHEPDHDELARIAEELRGL
jgi:histidine triad (HIT) family protein